MKIKALLFCITLLILYYFITAGWQRDNSELKAEQGQWQFNAIKAQSFLYDFNYPNYSCIIGSSLAFEIDQELLPKNYYNLSFRGQSILDGLQILRYKTIRPDTIFIETNIAGRSLNEAFVQRVAANKLEVGMKEKLPLLLEKYLPIGVLTQIIYIKTAYIWYYYKELLERIFNLHDKNDNNKINANLKSPVKKENLFEKVLILDSISLSKIPDKNKTEKVFRMIRENLEILEKKGAVLIFFEMPVHCKLAKTTVPTINKKTLQEMFPERKYNYIKNGGCENFETTDGNHLNKESASRFAKYFLNQKNNL